MNDFNYKHEFLEYLKKYGINKRILDIDNSGLSEFHKSLIDTINSQIDDLITMMSQSRNVELSIHVYCIDDVSVNAFCFVTNNHYYIGINSGAYIKLIDRTQILAESIIDNGYLNYTANDYAELHTMLWIFAFRMILSHEYMHIILGHCDWSCKSNAFLWETAVNNSIKNYRQQQSLEMLADEFACMDLINQAMYYARKSIDLIRKYIVLYYLSIILTFSIFEDDQNRATDHPHLSVRWHYIASIVDDILYKYFSKENGKPLSSLEQVDEIVMEYMQIIQNLPDLFKYNIVAELSTEEIDKEYVRIFNTAADIIPETNKQAIYPIEEIKKKDENMWVKTFKAKDEFIALIQKGMTYEEASDIIVKKYGDGFTDIEEELKNG